ncbi:serine/threonine-protein kinase [Streptomyces shenzhenensis]|uniref:non-specific serine/threonine protein kinase n=1 Tax=Streptomyces shenzhenensis TaxID=943815 RepID=A0A3M0IHA9_9ACTN|nr:serine/threonine-protein kinase [Streptomyces shenzhenensis]RMB85639.1 serine/threonine protein kinase [Streptomyces shenzhenensis]
MGEVFAGRYELADPIGRGGVGAVWRAWDHRRRRYVAAKVLQQRDAHSLLRFVREQALRIDHPHVLAPASWAADDDKVLFTMDLVAGGSLVHLVGDYGPLPPLFVCTLLDQLLSGLAAVHEEGVVHRDIKPANILLEATGTGRPRLRLSDFGIAMRLGEPRLTETNLVVGTPGYLAPEQMLGAEPGFSADLFAVGLVALYLLEGAKPDAKALVQYFAEHGTPGAPKGVPEPLWQVVSTLLQPDPEARFRTATGARKALASATQLLPEPGLDDELIEIFDQLGPLPPGFGPDGPFKPASGVAAQVDTGAQPGPPGPDGGSGAQHVSSPATGFPAQSPSPAPARPAPGGTGSVPGTPAASANPLPAGATGPEPPPEGAAPVAPHEGTGPQPSTMSDTGSFHLPPPQPYGTETSRTPNSQAEQPRPTPQQPPHAPQPHHPGHPPTATEPTHTLSSPQAPWNPAGAPPPMQPQRVDAPTASYTARNPQVPPPAQQTPPSVPRSPRRAARRAHRSRRPGPPAKAAIPILILALACYAVGFWALTRG